MKPGSATAETDFSDEVLREIASSFVGARRDALALDGYPGNLPDKLDVAYRIQDFAIQSWPDRVDGWKVGRIPPDVEDRFGIDRLAGPIFAMSIHETGNNELIDMPVFVGGFAAIEAEYVAVIGHDASPDKFDWTADEAASMIADLRIGLEIASSPLPTINELGPTAVVSDFGNNAGLIVGPSIRDWQTRDLGTMQCRAYVGNDEVGEGGAFNLTGGFVRSVQFLLELAAHRGRPLTRGQFVATGQTTGIHDVVAGQNGRLDFGDDGSLACRLVAAEGD